MKFLLLLVLQLVLNGVSMAKVFEFQFWPGPSAKNDPRFIAMHDGACGDVATARVHSIPKFNEKASFQPEIVFELNSVGRILRRWNIPVDAVPYALDKNELLFDYSSSVYGVSLSGMVRKKGELSQMKLMPNAQVVDCRLPKTFLGSDYAACWAFNDIRTKKIRILAFQGVCS